MGKTIAIIGSESVGKTTLAEQLSSHLNCALLPEYARVYLAKRASLGLIASESEIFTQDVEPIVIGQMLQEDSAKKNHALCVFDTTVLMSFIYAKYYFDMDLPWLEGELKTRTYDNLFVLSPEIPFEKDAQRGSSKDQMKIHELLLHVLENYKIKYELIHGNVAQRVAVALAQIK